MRIIKKINNNVAVALDGNGKEIIVFGKGVGFGLVPHELTDLSQVDRTFYDVDKRYFELLAEIPEKIFLLVTQLIDEVREKLQGSLSPSLPFVLADHVNFVLERHKKGLKVSIPYSYELEYEHPEIIEQASWFVARINERFRIELDESEVSIIAMHFLNALEGESDKAETGLSQKEISAITHNVTEIIERYFNFHLNRNSFHYLRYKNHIKYYLQRKSRGEEFAEKGEELYQQIRDGYPEIYKCVLQIQEYLETLFGKRCSHEELMYLMLHVSVLCEKNDNGNANISPTKT